jgi:double-strand break repair protein MRE11
LCLDGQSESDEAIELDDDKEEDEEEEAPKPTKRTNRAAVLR